MTDDADLSKALAKLAEGKFSFQMVDCITNSILTQQKELAELRLALNETNADLVQRDRKIFFLEASLKASNAAVFVLTKSNALTQEIIAATKLGFAKFNEVVLPIIYRAANEAKPYVIEALKYSYAVVLGTILRTEPQVRAWLKNAKLGQK